MANYDVIIIGAGVAGTTAGALLARKAGKKVLILEKEEEIGGRDISFPGEGIDTERYPRLIRGAAKTWFFHSEPHLEKIVKEKLLHGFTLEAGIHVLPHSEKGRTAILLEKLGKPIELFPVKSAGYFHEGRLYRMENGSERGGNFPWMSARDQEETARLNREMVVLSTEEAFQMNILPFSEWLKMKTASPGVTELHAVIATLNATINDPDQISAGDHILMNRGVARSGKRFSLGGCSTVPAPGFQQIPMKLAQVVTENGGAVRVSSPVMRVVVEKGRIKGVQALLEGNPEFIPAPVVVSSLPVKDVFRIIPEENFPVDFVSRVKSFWSAGAICIYYGLKDRVIKEDMTFVPRVLGAEDGYTGDVRLGFWASSNMDPSRAPEGMQLIDAYCSLTDQETYQKDLVRNAYIAMDRFFRQSYPGFEKNLAFAIVTVTDSLIPVAQAPDQVGEARPRAKCPWVEGLFFASDTAECWAAANDAAIHAGIICASRITGEDYLQLLPDYHR
ncbi:MAG: FAD-dependent oxidoreductase [Proteobacteria bacterium]|nr:FAD-dependent oxidoreductase [Pseudomonadota bacterium]